jgi:hypothetical protein
MDQAEFENTLSDVEIRLDRLRGLYEQWFQGVERLEPTVPRKEVERRIALLSRERPRNTAMRFRFQSLLQKYTTYQNYWRRVGRQIEEGTYRRDIMKARARIEADRKQFSRVRDEIRSGIPIDIDIDVELDGADLDEPELDTTQHAAVPANGDNGSSPARSLPRPGFALPRVPTNPNTPPPARLAIPAVRARTEPARTEPARTEPARTEPARAEPTRTDPTTEPRARAFTMPKPPSTTAPQAKPKVDPESPTPTAGVIPPAAVRLGTPRPPSTLGLARGAPLDPARREAVPRPMIPPPVRPAAGAPRVEDSDLRRVYERYIDARRRNNERTDNVPFETVAQNIRKMLPHLEQKHSGKRIEFEVVVKDGKVGLKPVPR